MWLLIIIQRIFLVACYLVGENLLCAKKASKIKAKPANAIIGIEIYPNSKTYLSAHDGPFAPHMSELEKIPSSTK